MRPATPLICRFIAEHKVKYGVAPICRTLSAHGATIAPRTYWAWVARAPSKRALSDIVITEIIAGLHEPDEHGRKKKPESLYGSLKIWAHLNRQGIQVARCTVERIMRINGWTGVTRARRVRTTISDPGADRAPDLVDRQFGAQRPNELFVADFTYVPMTSGVFAYTAFVIDACSRRIVGWQVAASLRVELALDALEMAIWTRRDDPLEGLVHHSDRGGQYLAIRYTTRLEEAGIVPSVGAKGDSFDNALAETVNGLYKAELIRRRGPWRTAAEVARATAEWVAWWNTQRLHGALGHVPPAEYEAAHRPAPTPAVA